MVSCVLLELTVPTTGTTVEVVDCVEVVVSEDTLCANAPLVIIRARAVAPARKIFVIACAPAKRRSERMMIVAGLRVSVRALDAPLLSVSIGLLPKIRVVGGRRLSQLPVCAVRE